MRGKVCFIAAHLLIVIGILAWHRRPATELPHIVIPAEVKEFFLGETVVMLVDEVLTDDDNRIVELEVSGSMLTVQDVKGTLLLARNEMSGKSGWITLDKVARIDRVELNRLTGLIASSPDNPVLHACRGMIYLKDGDFDSAISDYDEALRLRPEAVWYYNRGFAKFQKHEYDLAINDFNESINMDPKYAPSFLYRGRAWHEKSDYDKALSDLNESIRLNPTDSDSYFRRGFVLQMDESYEMAIRDFDEALRLEPSHIDSLLCRGDSQRHQGKFDKALADLDVVIRLAPPDAFLLRTRGEIRMANLQLNESIVDLSHSMEVVSNSEDALFQRGIAYMLLRRTESLDDFSQLINSNVSHTNANARIFGHLAARMLGDVPISATFLKVDLADWPRNWNAATIQYLRGELDQHSWLKCADTPRIVSRARCILGLQAVINQQDGLAQSHFRWVRDSRHFGTIEFVIASNELNRIESRKASGVGRAIATPP